MPQMDTEASRKSKEAYGSSLEPVESSSIGNISTPIADPIASKSFVRKCDWRLIPILALTYLFNSLDRSNLGNAKTAGLSKDVGLKGNQYNLILTFYYVPFVVFGPVGTILTKLISAKYSLAIMMVAFGIASLCTSTVKNFSGLFACRFFVGMFEAGFLPSVVVYLSTFYTRADIASRIGLFYAASVIASAFGGLLAFGVFHITNGSMYSWSYLFIIEGSLTTLVGLSLCLILPRNLQTAGFLNIDEKAAGEARQLRDSVDKINAPFNWSEALLELKNWHIYIRAVIGFCFGVLLASNANFLAIITARLGYSTVKTNLYTVAPAATAAVILVLICFSSDYFQERGFHMAGILSLSVIGYIILMTVNVTEQRGVAYFAIFLCTIGAYPMSVIFSAWTVANTTNLNSRSFTVGVLIPIGNAAGLLSSNIFFTNEAPRYMSALICNCVAAGICMILCTGYSIWMRYENRRRDAIAGMSPTEYSTAGILDTKDLRFRFQP